MRKEAFNFIDKLSDLNEVGDNVMIDPDFEYTAHQITRALYYHGYRQGKKFSRTKTPTGHLITLVAFR